ncbi:DNA-binding protein (plasmid) [Escherichia coli]
MALSQEDIWKAADELDATGARPTMAAIRKKLGTGSYTTINEALRQWKANRSAEPAAPKEPLPPTITSLLDKQQQANTTMAAELWDAALSVASQRFDADRQNFETERNALLVQVKEAVELADDVEESNRTLAAQLDEQRRENQDLRTKREELARQLREKTANADGQITALKEQLAALTAAIKPPRTKKGVSDE